VLKSILILLLSTGKLLKICVVKFTDGLYAICHTFQFGDLLTFALLNSMQSGMV